MRISSILCVIVSLILLIGCKDGQKGSGAVQSENNRGERSGSELPRSPIAKSDPQDSRFEQIHRLQNIADIDRELGRLKSQYDIEKIREAILNPHDRNSRIPIEELVAARDVRYLEAKREILVWVVLVVKSLQSGGDFNPIANLSPSEARQRVHLRWLFLRDASQTGKLDAQKWWAAVAGDTVDQAVNRTVPHELYTALLEQLAAAFE